MSEKITVFDAEVTLETIRCDVVAIGEGYSVTVQAVLDGNDILCARTVFRKSATFGDASDEMLPEAIVLLKADMEAMSHG